MGAQQRQVVLMTQPPCRCVRVACCHAVHAFHGYVTAGSCSSTVAAANVAAVAVVDGRPKVGQETRLWWAVEGFGGLPQGGEGAFGYLAPSRSHHSFRTMSAWYGGFVCVMCVDDGCMTLCRALC